ncbi:hypothetical protein IGI04_029263 [Brassica rapa subsp. trilocularis]|uniref:WRKY domain-containing protein n=1 Tax=Brassica rapa subsp. trilocularis TaxID=1813537 RepID=A0ABQ7LME9_BRACM|nr:probable WRKY transcription factor 10 [Brassica rapa]KAG5387722.1 hypothetical protein IGI04_029263 [Brassica rapa subsp. trilocularis]
MEMTSFSASQLIFTIAPPSPDAIIGPPEMVESSGGDHATMMISNNGLPHQRMDVDQAPEDHNIIDVLNVEPSSPKRRGNEVSLSNMIIASRTGRYDERVIIQMKSEENNLDDGYSWKNYGQKLIRGNPNVRRYYKCTFSGCDVKKHVERRADNAKSLVITYYGNHEHDAPVQRRKSYSLKKRSGSSMFQDASNRTPRLGRPPFSSSAFQVFPPSLEPHLGMTQINMNGLSKLPSLPANQMVHRYTWG